MKKTIILLTALLAIGWAKGQSCDSLYGFTAGEHYHRMEDVTQMRDGSILAGISLIDIIGSGPIFPDYGWCLLKVSRDDAQVIDSVIIEDSSIPWTSLICPAPDGNGYLFTTMRNLESDSTSHLSICRFDENLAWDLSYEARVPLVDSVPDGYSTILLVDDDIVVWYPVANPKGMVISRFSINGSLKNRKFISYSELPIDMLSEIKLWNESPKEYVIYGQQQTPTSMPGAVMVDFYYSVLDSLFNPKEIIMLKKTPEYPNIFFDPSRENDIESLDDNTYLFTSTYSPGINGVQVTKRDKKTHENLKTVYFPYDQQSQPALSQIIGMKKSSDGNVYLAYHHDGIMVVKLDRDLNVLWQRLYLATSWAKSLFQRPPVCHRNNMKALDNGGLAIGGAWGDPWNYVCMIVVNEDGDGIGETESFLRPYAFYPNPVRDELNLRYSPDVQPQSIELYDLQGRLLLKQSNHLESVDMQSLAAGQYMIKVVLTNGKAYTDKVVKE